jgi:hypothetical protein
MGDFASLQTVEGHANQGDFGAEFMPADMHTMTPDNPFSAGMVGPDDPSEGITPPVSSAYLEVMSLASVCQSGEMLWYFPEGENERHFGKARHIVVNETDVRKSRYPSVRSQMWDSEVDTSCSAFVDLALGQITADMLETDELKRAAAMMMMQPLVFCVRVDNNVDARGAGRFVSARVTMAPNVMPSTICDMQTGYGIFNKMFSLVLVHKQHPFAKKLRGPTPDDGEDDYYGYEYPETEHHGVVASHEDDHCGVLLVTMCATTYVDLMNMVEEKYPGYLVHRLWLIGKVKKICTAPHYVSRKYDRNFGVMAGAPLRIYPEEYPSDSIALRVPGKLGEDLMDKEQKLALSHKSGVKSTGT